MDSKDDDLVYRFQGMHIDSTYMYRIVTTIVVNNDTTRHYDTTGTARSNLVIDFFMCFNQH